MEEKPVITGYDMMIENAVFHAREECKEIVRSQFGQWDIIRTRDQLLFDIEQAWAEAEAKEPAKLASLPKYVWKEVEPPKIPYGETFIDDTLSSVISRIDRLEATVQALIDAHNKEA